MGTQSGERGHRDMRILKAIVEKRVEEFLAACRKKGLKLTHQRLQIYRELASTSDHPDAIMIHRRVRKQMPTVSLDTVYRNLRLLEKRGLISLVGKSSDRLRFDAELYPHHHFACVSCGKIRDFQSQGFGPATSPDGAAALGTPLSIYLEVRGICKSCQSNAIASRRQG